MSQMILYAVGVLVVLAVLLELLTRVLTRQAQKGSSETTVTPLRGQLDQLLEQLDVCETLLLDMTPIIAKRPKRKEPALHTTTRLLLSEFAVLAENVRRVAREMSAPPLSPPHENE